MKLHPQMKQTTIPTKKPGWQTTSEEKLHPSTTAVSQLKKPKKNNLSQKLHLSQTWPIYGRGVEFQHQFCKLSFNVLACMPDTSVDQSIYIDLAFPTVYYPGPARSRHSFLAHETHYPHSPISTGPDGAAAHKLMVHNSSVLPMCCAPP